MEGVYDERALRNGVSDKDPFMLDSVGVLLIYKNSLFFTSLFYCTLSYFIF